MLRNFTHTVIHLLHSGIKIVVLDTGVWSKDTDAKEGIGILISEDGSILKTNNIDDIGHGTAVISVLQRYVQQASIILIKIIFNGLMTNEEVLIKALEYIEKNIECDIIHISIGLQYCDNRSELYAKCKELYLPQSELILACQADAYILCVSCEDSIDYIKRTIKYLESVYPSKVICMALSPLKRSLRWSVLSQRKNMISKKDEEEAVERYKVLGIPVYIWREESQFDEMVQQCVDYFSETEDSY